MFALTTPNERGHDHCLGPFGQSIHRFENFFRCLLLDTRPALITVCFAKAGHQQAEIIVNLSGGRDRAAGIRIRCSLINGDCRLQSFHQINVRPLYLSQKLPRIHGKALDILSLAFRTKCISRKGTLTRTTRTCNYHKRIARNVEVNVLEVVNTGSSNAYGIGETKGRFAPPKRLLSVHFGHVGPASYFAKRGKTANLSKGETPYKRYASRPPYCKPVCKSCQEWLLKQSMNYPAPAWHGEAREISSWALFSVFLSSQNCDAPRPLSIGPECAGCACPCCRYVGFSRLQYR